MYYLCRVYTRRRRRDYRRDLLHVVNTLGDCRGNDRRNRIDDCSSNPFADRHRYANKLDFWGLDGRNNVCFIAYGSQWLWIGMKKENYQVEEVSKQYEF